ncbi:type II toxin-antitoxin system VapC family toxin [Gordonia neofelifaecis]|uniref:Ribonuclease VapC n=1 Tax=Gordonia neofelifaecis NRRL B-59395 TaxID=644548 RepID=F1YGY5_9ACTN|nr:type II toxin-antitoxin system VapC family toxin [Gordonia neofelifaecis]EGD56283.1 toxin [Gordonia neofelifaecis NRRL B-59395]
MIYLDTSALVKLLVAEAESADLVSWLDTQVNSGENLVSGDLARVEVMRTVARLDEPGLLDDARMMLDGLDSIPTSETVVDEATVIGPSTLRSVDAIHLAAASQLGSALTAFVAYDVRLHDAAAELGLPASAPGQAPASTRRA